MEAAQGRVHPMPQGRVHPLLMAAGAAVLLFSLLGMAAMTGIFA